MLILDEPMAGINPALVDRICEHISEIRASLGVTFLIVEHSLDLVERTTDHVVMTAAGSALATGTMAELRGTEAVVSAFLTGGVSDARAQG
jgi:ABC-type branched-subunit amino acid transport system ATPase component